MATCFEKSLFAYWNDGPSVVQAAMPLMKAYKRRGVDPFHEKFDPATFNKEKPWFCRLWGEVTGKGSDPIELAVNLSGEQMVELVAFLGPTMEAYPLLMSKERFDREYQFD